MPRIRRNNRNELIYTRKPARAQQHKLLEPQSLPSEDALRPGNPRLAGRNRRSPVIVVGKELDG